MNVREWALPVYTILMQLAVGSLFVLWMIRSLANSKFSHKEIDRVMRNPILVIAFTAIVAMAGAHFHLSKPFHSFFAVLNFKSSWLSREIVFSILFVVATLGLLYLNSFQPHCRTWITGVGWMAILIGSVLVYCMARIYLIPTQIAWNSSSVITYFYVTALILGCIAITCLLILDLKFAEITRSDDIELRVDVIRYSFIGLTTFTVLLVVLNIGVHYFQMLLLASGSLIARTSLGLLLDVYLPLLVLRIVSILSASGLLGVTVFRLYRWKILPQYLIAPVYISSLLILVGEIIGRFLFYATHVRIGL